MSVMYLEKTFLSTKYSKKAIRPFMIFSKIKAMSDQFLNRKHEDVHEFLRFLLCKLNDTRQF